MGRKKTPSVTITLKPGGEGKVLIEINGKNFNNSKPDEEAVLWDAMLSAVRGVDEEVKSSPWTSKPQDSNTTETTSES